MDVKLVHSSGHQALDNAAIENVRNVWRWEPPMRNGKAVVAHTPVNVVFNLATPEGEKRFNPAKPPTKKR